MPSRAATSSRRSACSASSRARRPRSSGCSRPARPPARPTIASTCSWASWRAMPATANRRSTYLRKAHEMAPQEPNPALELGFTLEAQHPREARKVYEQILARDPASRPALLGLARVARSQNRLDEARVIYRAPAAVNPRDPEALNGMAWLALANRSREQARAGFDARADARPGQRGSEDRPVEAPDVYRYLLDANGAAGLDRRRARPGVSARAGWPAITAFDTLELGWRHFTNELLTVSAIGLATLPSDDITVGYHRLVPLQLRLFPGLRLSRPRGPADRALDRRQRRLLPHRLAALVRRLPSVLRRPPVQWPPDSHRAQRRRRALLGRYRHGL